jgi:hypothetical protein
VFIIKELDAKPQNYAAGFEVEGGMEGGSGLGWTFSMENEERTTLRQGGGRDALVFHRTVPEEGVEVLIGRSTVFVADVSDSFGVGAVYGGGLDARGWRVRRGCR